MDPIYFQLWNSIDEERCRPTYLRMCETRRGLRTVNVRWITLQRYWYYLALMLACIIPSPVLSMWLAVLLVIRWSV